MIPARLILIVCKRAAHRGLDAEDVEVVGRHAFAAQLHRQGGPAERQGAAAFGGHELEHRVPGLPVQVVER